MRRIRIMQNCWSYPSDICNPDHIAVWYVPICDQCICIKTQYVFCIYRGFPISVNTRLTLLQYITVTIIAMASQIIDVSIVYSTFCSCADQRKHQSLVSLALVRGIHRWPVDSPHQRPVTRKMFPFDDVIMRPGYRANAVYSRYIAVTFVYSTRIRHTITIAPNNFYPDNNNPRVEVDLISIRRVSVWSICNRCRSEGLCYLGTFVVLYSDTLHGGI